MNHCHAATNIPELACRPFDRDRDGIVLGEGAAVFTLEDLEHARQRGARIYAEVVGFGAAFDAKPNGSGLVRAIRNALAEAGIGPEDVDHVNGHGLGTVSSDRWEARRSPKSSAPRARPSLPPRATFGNMGAASGSMELAASLVGCKQDHVPWNA